jgi:hypothetical protein
VTSRRRLLRLLSSPLLPLAISLDSPKNLEVFDAAAAAAAATASHGGEGVDVAVAAAACVDG